MTLERERIERLSIDQALGALDEDVDALLTAYLECDPSSAKAVTTLSDAAKLARRALGPRERRAVADVVVAAAAALPPFPADRLRAYTHDGRTRVMRLAGAAAALAACVLAGSILGAALARRAGMSPGAAPVARQEPAPPPARDAPIVRSAPAAPLFGAPQREAAGSDLWSARRLVAHAGSRQRQTSATPAFQWASPARLQWKEERP